MIPQHLHLRTPSPLIEWERLPVRVTTEAADWPRAADRPPRAGVSAFGISGVNAHVVLEGYAEAEGAADPRENGHLPAGPARPVAASLPESVADLSPEDDGSAGRDTRILPLSGKSEEAVRALAGRYLTWLDDHAGDLEAEAGASGPLLSDMAWTAGVGRSHLACRAGVVFCDAASLRERLKAVAGTGGAAKTATAAKVAFVYPGEGSQWQGMGKALYESEPVVRAVLDRCEAALGDARGTSLLDAMFGRSGPANALEDPAWSRPATYALACALTALWSSVGIRPSVVAGEGAGEIAAAQAASVLGLEDGLRLAAGDDPEAALEGVALAAPSIGLITVRRAGRSSPAMRRTRRTGTRQAQERVPLERCADSLAALGADVVIELGPQAVLGPALAGAWPASASTPTTSASLTPPPAGESGRPASGRHRDSWPRWPPPTRRGCRFPSRGCSRARHGAASRCRAIPSSGGATGSGGSETQAAAPA